MNEWERCISFGILNKRVSDKYLSIASLHSSIRFSMHRLNDTHYIVRIFMLVFFLHCSNQKGANEHKQLHFVDSIQPYKWNDLFGVNVLLFYVSRFHSLCLVCSAKIHRIEWFDILWGRRGINADVAELVLKNTTCKRLSRQSIYLSVIHFRCFCTNSQSSCCQLSMYFHSYKL